MILLTHTLEQLLDREWIATNGLGGFAFGTLAGVPTRGYHGLLTAAIPPPLGRLLLLGPLLERIALPDGTTVRLGALERGTERLILEDHRHLKEFDLELGLPVWRYEIKGCLVERRLWMPHASNTTIVRYRLLRGSAPVRLTLEPGVIFRSNGAPVDSPLPVPFHCTVNDRRVELTAARDLPQLRVTIHGKDTRFTPDERTVSDVACRVEQARGYSCTGPLYLPGSFTVELSAGEPVSLVASSESFEVMEALTPGQAEQEEHERRHRLLTMAPEKLRTGFGAELVLAADQFLVFPSGRMEESVRLRAAESEARSVVAGYPWFTDWGRDTMISLEGLTLATGRHAEAGYILRTFAEHVRDGLIPNFFPDGRKDGVYHTADATLWFFYALDRYLTITRDCEMLTVLLPKLTDIVEHHLHGTRFGIGVDSTDGLLRQGAPGYQLTWMDAKVGDWVVTPRNGKAVEINALWFNALCLLRGWLEQENQSAAAEKLATQIERVRTSFNQRFWNPRTGCLFDFVDGDTDDDPAIRPNQLLAISLPHPVLASQRWGSVLAVVQRELLTPVGLRSLAPGHRSYQPCYDGNLRMRDAAYHQGTVWTWLLGPFVDAWLKVHPGDHAGARGFLAALVPHLKEAGVGSISEIFDAEPPFTPRGCIAQAWSVAEVLRCWALTE
jgi:predicted glycogen debranching enzyme